MSKRDQETRLKDRIGRLEDEVSKTQNLIKDNNQQLESALLKMKLAKSEVDTIRESLDGNETHLAEFQEELVSCRHELTLLSGPRKRRKIEGKDLVKGNETKSRPEKLVSA